jgi:oxygen-independent coproporphyrinogen III oxidase
VHLYIHVPFCARRCSYCDFAIAVRRATPDTEFVAAIESEWTRRREHPLLADGTEVTTLYFGGGTPSRLASSSLVALIDMVGRDRGLATDAEITIEVNPDDVTAERAIAWHRAGVNRVSLGVQSHDAAVLEWMHRSHRAEQVAPAVAMLREAGFDNLSIDMIYALPESLDRDWPRDLALTIALEPEHLSLYGLTVEPQTPLGKWTARGESIPTPDERYATDFLHADRTLGAAGYEHYEVSNYGKPGRRSRHNSTYWTGADYLGLGPSAHSLLGGVRSWNVREWAEYLTRSGAGLSVEGGSERVDEGGLRIERLYLGLRTSGGVPAAELPARAREDWLRAGWATVAEGQLRLSPEGWLRLDALVAAVADS